MNEREIFDAALDQATREGRSKYLDAACAGDAALRQRVEELLTMHEQTGEFLQKPLAERLAAGIAALEAGAETPCDTSSTLHNNLAFLSPSDQPDSIGRIGHYEVKEVIGSGGMGIVLRAFDEKLHRVVAIKVMAAPLAISATARKRFLREARAAAAVCHDHIVTIYAVEDSADLPYLVMQLVSGLSLQERLDRDGPLAVHEILRIGMQTAAGLAAAHAQGLIHRDIKPANILLENGVERVKITDFGLARAAADASVSQTGIVAGTPQYMAPEQARGETLDGRTDLFSLGSVLYAMAAGRAPFRASGSMAVLKRVCDDTPTPIRQINPEIPDWLAAIIDKLHAKEPAERFQSAAEVAELLGRHLAHVQHPSVTRLPSPHGGEGLGARRQSRHWAMAAAVLLVCLLGGLSVTEATGVTRLASTVVRIFTPDGTLVVETDDPGVKVTVEGDGGLVVTGAGLEEIRLKPGSYRVQAVRDGQPIPLERELVTVSRGGRETVRVKLEAHSAAPVAAGQRGAFVLLAAGKERNFDTLAEAVIGASDGDTIEIRGNGPFVTKPLIINNTALTIRAGQGFRPVIQFAPADGPPPSHLLASYGPLVLEGLEFQRLPQDRPKEGHGFQFILCGKAHLYVGNCRFVPTELEKCVCIEADSTCEIRNSEILVPDAVNVAFFHPGQQFVVENCLLTGIGFSPGRHWEPDEEKTAFIQLTRNTIVDSSHAIAFWFWFDTVAARPKADQQLKFLSFKTAGNVFEANGLLEAVQMPGGKVLAAADVEAFLANKIGWQGERNLYALDSPFLKLSADAHGHKSTELHSDLAAWKGFSGSTEDSVEGSVHFHGGNLRLKLSLAPERFTPDDFRLRPDSAGYRAGKDGKDLGADVDLVGPGAAYERWKKTAQYQQWLKDTRQVANGAAVSAEAGAFVLQGAKNVPERKFDTLAEAVLRASAGDTIEIRGNGPFVSEPIKVTRALIIRAGAGYRPVIQLSPEAIAEGANLMETLAPLIVEGLELQRVPQTLNKHMGRTIILARAPLHVANCRFLVKQSFWGPPIINSGPNCELRNCEIIGDPGQLGIAWYYSPHAQLKLDNCCVGNAIRLNYLLPNQGADYTQACTLRMTRNTFVSDGIFMITVYPGKLPNLWTKDLPSKPTRCETAGNIFDARQGVVLFSQEPPGRILSPEESEESLPQVLTWHGTRNLYAVGGPFLRFYITTGKYPAPANPIKSVAGWGKYWGTAEAASIEGSARYQGGDMLTRLAKAPEKLTPEDFRLRPDSVGYQAGKDGKNLGADVDLVGPGAAYERWKKTPEYQQWLKDTGQEANEAELRTERGAFVLLGGKNVPERKFDILAEAVAGASAGDTIEIRGNGPFVTDPVMIGVALRIRAADGFRPTLRLSEAGVRTASPVLEVNAPLVLEGLELQRISSRIEGSVRGDVVRSRASSLHVANCRLLLDIPSYCITSYSPQCFLRNSELITSGGYSFQYVSRLPGQFVLDNCVGSTGAFVWDGSPTDARSAQLSRSTLVGTSSLVMRFRAIFLAGEDTEPRIAVQSAGNVFGGANLLSVEGIEPARTLATLPRRLAWQETDSVYTSQDLLRANTGSQLVQLIGGVKALDAWRRLWDLQDGRVIVGPPRFRGDVQAKLAAAPGEIAPDDFRLNADSPAYRAGEPGEDLGANVDLVGPGAAYERWKKTPEYQQWLKDTGQLTRGAASGAEPGAFIVLGGKGSAERKFDTLTEAARISRDGDTIEIRGNGPFVSDPVTIGVALRIRAADGFRPTLRLSDAGARTVRPLLEAHAPLVLEGLELQRIAATRGQIVVCRGPTLHVANCRFLHDVPQSEPGGNCITSDAPNSFLTNSEFLTRRGFSFNYVSRLPGQLVMENCVGATGAFEWYGSPADARSAHLTLNTFVGSSALSMRFSTKFLAGEHTEPSIAIQSTSNVFGGSNLLWVEGIEPAQTMATLPQRLGWQEAGSLYPVQNLLSVDSGPPQSVQLIRGEKALEEWRRLWTLPNDVIAGAPSFRGHIQAKLAVALGEIAPDDFRLAPGSPGQGAGPGGKDLGADVDLVGPGVAYEQWKKTPKYQQWLEETGQQQ